MTKHFSRREFLQTSVGISIATPFLFKTPQPKLSFSTLGCPEWTFSQILEFATANHYDGIELRGLQKEMDLTKCKEFSKENISSTLQQLKERNLKIVNLGASAVMHLPEGEDRSKSLGEAKSFI